MPENEVPSPAPAPAKLTAKSKTIITMVLVSTFVVFLNETILGVALPDIMKEMQIPASTGQWLSTAYMLTMAVVIPITGYLLQRLTTRQVYSIAMALFIAGSLIAALSPNFEFLLIGRIFQASGTAVMMPLLMTTVMTLVPADNRGSIMGTISIVMSVAPAIGPAISGLVLSFADWRWLFWLVLPIALAAGIVGFLRMENYGETSKPPLDALSVVLSAVAFSGLIYGLSSFADAARGTAAISPWVPTLIGAAAFTWFVLRQAKLQKKDAALLDLRTFRSNSFTVSISLMAISMLSLFGTLILLPIYVQNVLGVTPLVTGLYLLPGGLIMGLLGPIVGRWYDRIGARPLVMIGSLLSAAASWFMLTFDANTPSILIPVAHIVLSLGLALLFTPLFTFSMSSVPPQFYSHASAIIGTIQQIAGAAGTALFVTLLTTTSIGAVAAGTSLRVATAQGIHAAFISGAVLSLVTIALTLFVRKPATEAELLHELEH